MSSLLLLNPRKRRRKGKKANPTRRHRARRARRPNPFAHVAKRRTRRRRTSVMVNPRRRMSRRRRNPIRAYRRRRNPIGISMGGIMGLLKEAGTMAAGAVGVDLIYAQVNGYLPASLQIQSNTVGAGDAVKLAGTIVVGAVAGKRSALVRTMILGSVASQMYDIAMGLIPSSMGGTSGMAGLGFYNPGAIIPAQFFAKPNRNIRGAGMAALLPPGRSSSTMHGAPRLSALLTPGARTGQQAIVGRSVRLASVYTQRAAGISS